MCTCICIICMYMYICIYIYIYMYRLMYRSMQGVVISIGVVYDGKGIGMHHYVYVHVVQKVNSTCICIEMYAYL